MRTEVVEVAKREFVVIPEAYTQPRPDPERPAIRTGADACADSKGRPVLCADQLMEWGEAWRQVARAERCDKATIGCLQRSPEDIQGFMVCFEALRRPGGLCGYERE